MVLRYMAAYQRLRYSAPSLFLECQHPHESRENSILDLLESTVYNVLSLEAFFQSQVINLYRLNGG